MSTLALDIPATPGTAFETITVSSTPIGGTASKLTINQAGGFRKRAQKAVLSVESQPIRFRYDGTSPSSTVGHLLAAGDYFTVNGEDNVAALKMIATGTDATVQVTFHYSL